MRICFFGDSFVNGTGDDTALGWVGRVCVAARRAGRDVTGYNLGVRGHTSLDVAARWRNEAHCRLPPDQDGRLVFAFGANDGATDATTGGARVSLERSLAVAETVLTEARAWKPVLMIGPLPVGDDAAADDRIAVLSDGLGRLCGRLDVPYRNPFAEIARCDIWRREAAANDGAHPNAGGYDFLARLIEAWPPWREWIENRQR